MYLFNNFYLITEKYTGTVLSNKLGSSNLFANYTHCMSTICTTSVSKIYVLRCNL